ncbi:hypothetical protein [uncultured Polaribacter sp.]|uniref:DUF6973 domain-containing protein n=1 Tax=uncultured Polaribacter sp. TaxID=174711 RepID=UPI00260C23CB|nr:hypothetical protein [uncultured Polaribacter sp.]
MKKTLFILTLLCTLQTFSQSKFKGFSSISNPTKVWIFFHIFKANRSLKVSIETNKVSDSIKRTKLLDGDGAGGQVDAFRHAYWMARLRQEIGEKAARSLGKAHEKGNYLTFKKMQLEDGVVPDEISSEMDLHNNEEGLKLTFKRSNITRKELIYKIVNSIKKGNMRIIKKDDKGNFLTCDDQIISKESLKGKWKNNKCLVTSKK